MEVRRIVTGHDGRGKSIVQSDEPLQQRYDSLPGFSSTMLWSTAPVPAVGTRPATDPAAVVTNFLPSAGETRLMTVTLPPDASMMSPEFDGAAYFAETARRAPGFETVFEPDAPGMHTTQTVDYGVVLDGEVWLELDEQRLVHLKPKDVIVQNGTRHAWRNKSDRPSTLLFVLIGATRAA